MQLTYAMLMVSVTTQIVATVSKAILVKTVASRHALDCFPQMLLSVMDMESALQLINATVYNRILLDIGQVLNAHNAPQDIREPFAQKSSVMHRLYAMVMVHVRTYNALVHRVFRQDTGLRPIVKTVKQTTMENSVTYFATSHKHALVMVRAQQLERVIAIQMLVLVILKGPTAAVAKIIGMGLAVSIRQNNLDSLITWIVSSDICIGKTEYCPTVQNVSSAVHLSYLQIHY